MNSVVIRSVQDISGSYILSWIERAKANAGLFVGLPEEFRLNLIVAIFHFYKYRSNYINAKNIVPNCWMSDKQVLSELESGWGDRLKKNVYEAMKLEQWRMELVDVAVFFIDDASNPARTAAVFAHIFSLLDERNPGPWV